MFLLQLLGKFQSFHRFHRSPSFIPMLTKYYSKLFFKAVILFALIIWSLGHFLLPDWCPLLTSWLIDRLKRRKSHKYIIVPYRYITLHYITYRYIHYMKRHYSMKLITLTTCDCEEYYDQNTNDDYDKKMILSLNDDTKMTNRRWLVQAGMVGGSQGGTIGLIICIISFICQDHNHRHQYYLFL